MGAFCCHENKSFDPICPKTLSSISPTPMMLHIKIDQDWPTGFRDIQVWKCEIFVTQGQVTQKRVVWPAYQQLWWWLIKTGRASMETAFSHYKSMANFLDAQGQLTPLSVAWSGRNSNLSEILCKSPLPASIKRIEKRWRHHFPHFKSMGAFCCHGKQNFDPICPKTLCSLSPTPVMLHIKFDQDWPTGFRNIQVWKCGWRRTDDRPLVYYKLTLWDFSWGELKMPKGR